MTNRGLAGFDAKPCEHPINSVVPHPTKPGKSICRGCGQVCTIMTHGGPILLPKVEL